MRTKVEIQPNGTESLCLITAVGKSREEVLFLARRYSDVHSVKRAFEMAWSKSNAEQYRGEPYVTSGDVYSQPPHTGRAGWSWYTGSCGWLYQAGLDHILGLKLTSHDFTIDPCIPATWKSYSMRLTRGDVVYRIEVENPGGVQRGVVKIELDGVALGDKRVTFAPPNSGEPTERFVRVVMGESNPILPGVPETTH